MSGAFWQSPGWWKATGKASVWMFVGTGLGFLATVLAARSLGPEGYGLVVLAVSVVGSIATFLDVSLEEAVIHFGVAAAADGDTSGVKGLLRTSLRLDAVVGMVVFTVLLAFAGPLSSFMSDGVMPASYVVLAALEALAVTTNGTTGAALQVTGHPELRAWAMAWTNALRLAAVLVSVAVWDSGEAVLCAYVVGSALGALLQGLLARREARRVWGDAPAGPSPVPTRRMASFGAHSSASTTVIAARLAIVAIVLGRLSGAASVGVFNVAMLPVILVGIATAPLRIMTFPEQARLAAEGRGDVLWRGIKVYTRLGLLAGTAAAVVGWFLLPWLVTTVFSDAYRAAIEPARVMLVAGVATLAVVWAKALPAAIGRPRVRTMLSLGELAVTTILVMALADRGATGAAIAVTTTSVLAAIVWWFVAQRMLARMRPETPSASTPMPHV